MDVFAASTNGIVQGKPFEAPDRWFFFAVSLSTN
jgi:hypothetical protein